MSERWCVKPILRRTALLVAACGVVSIPGLAARPAPAEPGATIVGQWRFDEPDGQLALDDSPHGLAGALGASDLPDAADPERIVGASGGALRFDGGAVVRLPDSAALAVESLSAEAVVRAGASPGSWRYLVSRGGQGCYAGSYGLYTGVAGGLALYVFDGTRYVVSATARPADVWDGAWHQIAGTFDGRALRLFVDGRPVGDPMEAPLRIRYDGMSPQTSLGQYVGDCGLGLRADLDLVRLWSGARSPAAIAAAAGVQPGGQRMPAAEPGTVLGAGGAPGSRPRGCVVKLLRSSTRGPRRTVIDVRVTAGRRPLRGTRLVARRAGRRTVLAMARSDATGRARLAVRSRRGGRLRITARGRPGCTPARLRVRGSGAPPGRR